MKIMIKRPTLIFSCLISIFFTGFLYAGGPLILFSPGVPYQYDTTSPVVYNLDQGDFGPLTNAQADVLSIGSFDNWGAVPTATISFVQGADLPVDVVLANADTYLGSPGVGDGLNPVVYDSDGSIIANYFGAPPGVLGIAGPTTALTGTNILTASFSIFDGTDIDPADLGNSPPGAVFQGVITHEHGHFINLAHTIVNGQALFWADNILPDGTDLFAEGLSVADISTMYPFISVSGVSTGEFQAVPGPDDIAILSTLYPAAAFFSTTGTITGTIYDTDGTTGLTGVQVIARNVNDLVADAVSAISGDFTQGAGPLGINDGSFTINGLTPGQSYLLYISDAAEGGFSTPVFVTPGGGATPSLGDLPGPREFYNGANESSNPDLDDPALFSPIPVVAGSPATADIILNRPGEPTPVDPGVCLATTDGFGGAKLLTIDPITGAGTLIGETGLSGIPGLAVNADGFVFGTERVTGELYKFNSVTGEAIFTASTGLSYLDAIGFSPDDVLYGIDLNGDLYSIDVETGASQWIGNTGELFSGMAFDPTDGKLYASTGRFSAVEDAIYQVDIFTAQATLVGVSGLGGAIADIFFTDDGSLYGVKGTGSTPSTLIAIDKTTGVGAVIGPTGFAGIGGMSCRNIFNKQPINLLACLRGDQVVPPLQTTAAGGGFFTLNAARDSLTFEIEVNQLSGPVLSASFENAPPGSNGPVVRTITAEFSGESAVGVWTSGDAEPLTPGLVSELLAGRIYVNIATAANPSGEIRGQATAGLPTTMYATLEGAQEVPPVSTPAIGNSVFTLSANGDSLAFDIVASGLSGSITAAHFHDAPAGSNGPAVRTLTPDFVGNQAVGNWTDSDPEPLTPRLVAKLLAEKIYVNIHTALNPSGEIRGQIGKELPSISIEWCETSYLGGPGSIDTVYVCIGEVTGRDILAYQLEVSFDETVLSVVGATSAGTISQGFGDPIVNTGTPGKIVVGAFGTEALTGSGALVGIIFNVVGAPGSATNLCIDKAILNANNPLAKISVPCVPYTVQNVFSIAGNISYCQNSAPVDSVQLNISGAVSDSLVSDISGNYLFNNIAGGLTYTVTPSKSGDIPPLTVTCFDAALIAQIAVGILLADHCDSLSADVDEDGNIFTFDAALVCRYAVGLAPFGPTDHSGEWRFEPAARSYTPLLSNQTNQDFSAVLLGDIDGSWTQALRGLSGYSKSNPEDAPLVFVDQYWSAERDEVSTTLWFDAEFQALSFQIDLNYAPGQLQLMEATTSLSGWELMINDDEKGRLRVGMFSPGGHTGKVEAVTLKWKVRNRQPGMELSVSHAMVNDYTLSPFTETLEAPQVLPEQFALYQNFPNPFNPATYIRFDVPAQKEGVRPVRLAVYNLLGQLVQVLADEKMAPGSYKIMWNGQDAQGQPVPSGVYFYSLSSGSFSHAKKMLLLK